MDVEDEEHLKSLHKRRMILKRRIDIDEEQITKGIPSVHIRIDLEEAKSDLSKVEEEIEYIERKQRYRNKIPQSSIERGKMFFEQAKELLSEIEGLETSGKFEQYRVDELRTQAKHCLKLAIRNGFINTKILFLLAQIYDLEGSRDEAFEYSTASIKVDEGNHEAYKLRSMICETFLRDEDGSAKLITHLMEKDQKRYRSARVGGARTDQTAGSGAVRADSP